MPAQELSEAGKYLAGAYGVFVALLLVYLAIMAAKLSRMERRLSDLARRAEERGRPGSAARDEDAVAEVAPAKEPV